MNERMKNEKSESNCCSYWLSFAYVSSNNITDFKTLLCWLKFQIKLQDYVLTHSGWAFSELLTDRGDKKDPSLKSATLSYNDETWQLYLT